MNNNRWSKIIILLLLLCSVVVFAYFLFARINVSDILYYRVSVYDLDEIVTFRRSEIDLAIKSYYQTLDMLLASLVLLILLSIYSLKNEYLLRHVRRRRENLS